MSSITREVASNSKYNSTQNNQRGAAIVRVCGEEHVGIKNGGDNIFFLMHDNDMCYISDYKFKLIFGTGGVATSESSTTPVPETPPGWGTKIYTSIDDFMSKAGIGTAWDVDNNWGAQCWDYAALFWRTMTGRDLYTGKNKAAKEAWTESRTVNAGTEFDLVTNFADLKKGDWAFWSRGTTGHVALIVESPSGNTVKTWAQNITSEPAAIPYPSGGTAVVEHVETNATFLGAFRYKW